MPWAVSRGLYMSSATVTPIRLTQGKERMGIAFLRGDVIIVSSQAFMFISHTPVLF
jgi:hypothetical protein